MIINSRGQLVWFRPVRHRGVYNLEVQSYRGRPVLTWWQGLVEHGYGVLGRDVIMNRAYRPVAELRGGYGYSSDLHEFQLARNGIALIDASDPVRANLSSVGGPANGVVIDSVVQELDVKTGQVLWEWHALGHVPLSASYDGAPRTGAYDYFHLNSIQQLPSGNLLISSRNTWAVYEISHRTGRVIWTLGGKRPTFTMGPRTSFEWQHDAHLTGHTLTLFDDDRVQSSAKELNVDTASRTVALIRSYHHSPPLLTGYMGSMQLLPGGKVFVGWGDPEFSEYTPGGRQIFNGSFALGVSSYRAYRFPWKGRPVTRPAVAITSASHGGVDVWMSWNGATAVAAWRVLGGNSRGVLSRLAQDRRSGFETKAWLPRRPRYLMVQALSERGQVLGTSRAVARHT